MLERYSCNRNVTLSRVSCILCSISATTRWDLDRSYLAHKRMPHGLYRHRPCATVLTLGPLLACASVILRTGLQPSTLRERCRGLDAVSFGEVLQHAQGTHQGRADLGIQLRLGLTFHEFLHGKSCDWFRHGSRRAPARTNYCTLRAGHGHVVAPRPSSWARSARRTPMRYHCHCWERAVCFYPVCIRGLGHVQNTHSPPQSSKAWRRSSSLLTLLVLNCYHPYSRQCLVITAGIFQL